MIKDIYIRNPEDPNYIPGLYEYEDVIESIISKIKVILGTRQGQVLGDVNFGIPIEDLVFETKINKFELEEKIKEQIHQYISEASRYKIEPKVSFGNTGSYDYCIIDFYINGQKTAGIIVK